MKSSFYRRKFCSRTKASLINFDLDFPWCRLCFLHHFTAGSSVNATNRRYCECYNSSLINFDIQFPWCRFCLHHSRETFVQACGSSVNFSTNGIFILDLVCAGSLKCILIFSFLDLRVLYLVRPVPSTPLWSSLLQMVVIPFHF